MMVAKEIGIDLFDDTTYEPSRLMYWPSTPSDGEFVSREKDGIALDPDAYLTQYHDWRDCSLWPTSKRQSEVIGRTLKQQQNPLGKSGAVGAFCRTYTIEAAIEKFLPTVYESSAMPGRYDYIPADSSAGVVVYDGKFAFSHHATDPACGRLLNAFDLVRVHKYGDQDEKLSFKAMSDFAVSDECVKTQFAQERQAQAENDFADEDWQSQLELEKSGKVKDTLDNIVAIIAHDENLGGIAFNQHRDGIDVRGKLPWEQTKPGWNDSDSASLKVYLSRVYGVYSPTKTKDAVLAVASGRKYHPIKIHLESLPPWDGTKRIDTLLIDYLGAEDSSYTRAVTRKTLAASVARIYAPGTKFDSVLILSGPQGIGKSTLFSRLAGAWFSDSLTLTDMRDKTGAEKLQGYWILELGELAGMRKTDVETVKSFVSRTDDKYRASYGLNVENHPRQCVIVGSTNSDTGFLRDVTGNRRFWPVKVDGTGAKKPWQLAEEDVRQIWAEAIEVYKNNERLYLEGDEAVAAALQQADAMETDEREGLVREYLERLLPDNWDSFDIYRRQDYFRSVDDPTQPKGKVRRLTASNIEIWCECFGKHREDIKMRDSYEITAIIQKMTGWQRSAKKVRTSAYGPQYVWERTHE